MSRAAALAGVDRSTPYTSQWRDDPVFAKAFQQAKQMAADTLEAEAIRRAFEGVETPTGWYKGEPGAFVRAYSDVLLIFLLKGAFPDKYANRQMTQSIVGKVNIRQLPDEAVSRIANGEALESVLASLAQDAVARGCLPTSADEANDSSGRLRS